MTTEVPPISFELDSDDHIQIQLHQHPGNKINNMLIELHMMETYPLISAAGSLIVPEIVDPSDALRRDAFLAGAVLAFLALEESNATPVQREQTMKYVLLGHLPSKVCVGDSDHNFDAFEQISQEGFVSDFQLIKIEEIVKQYYTGVTQDTRIGRIASMGIGFGLYSIDRAWSRYREVRIEQIIAEEMETSDPYSLFNE